MTARQTQKAKPKMTRTRSSAALGDSSHIDFGRLDQRVATTEETLKTFGGKLDGVVASIGQMSSDVGSKIDRVANSLDAKIVASAAKPQDWRAILGLFFSAVVIAGSIYVYTQTQTAANITRVEGLVRDESTERKSEVHDLIATVQTIVTANTSNSSIIATATAQHLNDAKRFDDIEVAIKGLWEKEWPKEAQVEYEKRIDQVAAIKAEYDRRDFSDLKTRVETVDSSIIKRPEIEAALKAVIDRLDALSVRENNTEQEVHSGWSLSDTVKSIESRIENLRIQFGTALIPAAAAPVMPGK